MAALKSSDEKLVEATVAPGRTVHIGVKTSQTFDLAQQKQVDVAKPEKVAGPGEKVSLPESEVRRLQTLGFLLKPGSKPIPTGNGPTFSPEDGPKITEE